MKNNEDRIKFSDERSILLIRKIKLRKDKILRIQGL